MNDTDQHYRAIALGRGAHAHTNCAAQPSTVGGHRNSLRGHVLGFTRMFVSIGMKRPRGRVFAGEGVA